MEIKKIIALYLARFNPVKLNKKELGNELFFKI